MPSHPSKELHWLNSFARLPSPIHEERQPYALVLHPSLGVVRLCPRCAGATCTGTWKAHAADRRREWKVLTLRVDRMTSTRAVPLRDARRGLHLLDDLTPPDPGVVGAEADLTHLRAVRDDAHLRAAEV